ncbi:SCP2 sterol-binding domain-containing protein [Micromonospora sp. KC723]|uniref:SCP2 sterol-binding domain-containing protein n=1 Tax=Micromonospora sp. KC723 TaxID=2530381 RepID=UPI00104EB92F|nr:SCP2 sterol-binding domain-containing protein [Micromonospora sp. KC723]TDB74850.1 hypothetical protein E1165_13215 [Micromonospora sp. KC723]
MYEATEEFFAALPARAPSVLRGPVRGTLQIALTTDHHTDYWLLRLAPHQAVVTRGRGPADAVLSSSAEFFERLVTGRAQGISAVLRNEATFSGNVLLFLAFRRFFPARPGARDPRELARDQLRRSG